MALSASTSIDFNPQFVRALASMQEGKRNVLVTGRAGTGKSTLLAHFCRQTPRDIVVLAPTGVAAVNVGGQTIHSFFGFKPDVTPEKVALMGKPRKPKMYGQLKTIVIDEISMVRADLFDAVEIFLRRFGPIKGKAFGGVQLVLVGDVYQLPPVVPQADAHIVGAVYKTPYFFSSRAMERSDFELVELEQVYRQSDSTFVDLLNAVRNNTIDAAQLAALNARCEPGFVCDATTPHITLTTTNRAADLINDAALTALGGRVYESLARVDGSVERQLHPANELLKLKIGAQVMMLNNEPGGRWMNGTLGVVETISGSAPHIDFVQVRLETGDCVDVMSHHWDMFRFSYDAQSGAIKANAAGSFEQFPLQLAWAVTIHKSQGKTFEHVVVDFGGGTFAPGQAYVALSRCTSLEGLVLRRAVRASDIRIDEAVVSFMTRTQYAAAELVLPRATKEALIRAAIAAGRALRMVYLRASDVKVSREIEPLEIGDMEHRGEKFLGLRAKDERVYSVERILELAEI